MTNREIALDWWAALKPLSEKIPLMSKYELKTSISSLKKINDVTEEEIEDMWDKEVNEKGKLINQQKQITGNKQDFLNAIGASKDIFNLKTVYVCIGTGGKAIKVTPDALRELLGTQLDNVTYTWLEKEVVENTIHLVDIESNCF